MAMMSHHFQYHSVHRLIRPPRSPHGADTRSHPLRPLPYPRCH
jgi:hypothetical protein